eukprot:TRINITY_DN482_c0_g2_i1.p1 TRINITY_DN482_c0_g2~~TRINITY_DN482_c0_g2_i1.p1  ORF type:complete len:3075 (-),score=512.01 TRINITY_DN482_c0_g2_i1:2052-9956(-)
MEIIANPNSLVSNAADYDVFVDELNTVILKVCPGDGASSCESECGPHGACACSECECKFPFEDSTGPCDFCPRTQNNFCSGRGSVTDDCLECNCPDCTNGATQDDFCDCDCAAASVSCFNGGTVNDDCGCNCPSYTCSNGGSKVSDTCGCNCKGLFEWSAVTEDCTACKVGDTGQCATANGDGFFNDATCQCECPSYSCVNGGTKDSSTCGCICAFPFAVDASTGQCTMCATSDVGQCGLNGGSFSAATCGCSCPAYTCSNGGTPTPSASGCTCACSDPFAYDSSTGQCSDCSVADNTCGNNGGNFDTNTCSCDCNGFDCGDNGDIRDGTCRCRCTGAFDVTGPGNDGTCDGCETNPAQCQFRGVPSYGDCDNCDCTTPCANGGSFQSGADDCSCNCASPWKTNSGDNDDCTSCDRPSDYCNNAGDPTDSCDGCDCDSGGCYNGAGRHSGSDSTSDSDRCTCDCSGIDCGPHSSSMKDNCSCRCKDGYMNQNGKTNGNGNGLCDYCSGTASDCNNKGLPDISNSCNCQCTDGCSNGGTQDSDTCECSCDSDPFAYSFGTGDCTQCTRTNADFCNNMGTVITWRNDVDVDCKECDCWNSCYNGFDRVGPTEADGDDRCLCMCPSSQSDIIDFCGDGDASHLKKSNGDVYMNRNGRCGCQCQWPWRYASGVSNGPCTRCHYNDNKGSGDIDEYCNYRGTINSDCDTCTCTPDSCGEHGQSTGDNCGCTCDANWSIGDDHKCSVCTRTRSSFCNNKGDVQDDCESCDCDYSCSNSATPYGDDDSKRCKCDCSTIVGSDDFCGLDFQVQNNPFNSRCECNCKEGWSRNYQGKCISCDNDDNLGSNGIDAYCNYNGGVEGDCETCQCVGNPCPHDGAPDADVNCACACEFPWKEDCSACDRDASSFCNNGGTFSASNPCRDCECTRTCYRGAPNFSGLESADADKRCDCDCGGATVPCTQGKGSVKGSNCECQCNSNDGWTKPNRESDCTVCSRDTNDSGDIDAYCNMRGSVDPTDCKTCQCVADSCTNGGVPDPDNQCRCGCVGAWQLPSNDATGTCSVCVRRETSKARDSWCNSRGTVQSDCTTCTCTDACDNGAPFLNDKCDCNCGDCGNGGTPDASCSCSCPSPYTEGDDGKCSWCFRGANEGAAYCNNRGTVVKDTVANPECMCSCGVCSNGGTNNDFCSCACPLPFTADGDGDCNKCHPTIDEDDVCNNRGTLNGDCATCTCRDDWESTGAGECLKCGLVQADCEHGSVLNEATCRCECDSTQGWNGVLCDACPVPVGDRPTYCDHGSTWNGATCACACGTHWGGLQCDDCDEFAESCSNHGFLFSSAEACRCVCNGNWDGDDCDVCPPLICKNDGFPDTSACACSCIQNHEGESCGICASVDCGARGQAPESDDSDCGCKCANWWINNYENDVYDCSICPEEDPQGDRYCGQEGRGRVDDSDCDDCICEQCSNGGTAGPNCECSCPGNWGVGDDGDCSVCTLSVEDECNGRAFGFDDDCKKCDCVPCAHGGTNSKDCWCECPDIFPTNVNGDCGVCSRDDSWCNHNGVLNVADCTTCDCVECKHGGTLSDDGRCACECEDPWGSNEVSTQCTECTRDDSYCNNRGKLDKEDCESCLDTECANDGNCLNNRCDCECYDPWTNDDDNFGDCTLCVRSSSDYCNGRGSILADCETCDGCYDCAHNGTNTEFCLCDCVDPWARGDDGDCSVCTRNTTFCNDRGNIDLTDCKTCFATKDCANKGTLTETLACDCSDSRFDNDPDNNDDCTLCTKTSQDKCHGRGVVNADCKTCTCPLCQNNGIPGPKCDCECPHPWEQDQFSYDCTLCTRNSDNWCNGNGDVAADCETCVCKNDCGKDQFRHPDCSCSVCEYPFTPDSLGECTVCERTADEYCNGLGVVGDDCASCVCESDACLNGGEKQSDCTCECLSSNFASDLNTTDCTVCLLTTCSGNGVVNQGSCSCECQTCSNDGTSDNEDCSCACPDIWTNDLITGDCTVCTLTGDDLCSGRGIVKDDCETCLCDSAECANGAELQGDCSCKCVGNWANANDATADCTVCLLDPVALCGGGRIDAACEKCDCPACLNGGTSNSDCTCQCVGLFTNNEEGVCTKCIQTESNQCTRGGVIASDCLECVCPECENGELQKNNATGFFDCNCECAAGFAKTERGDCLLCVEDGFCQRGGARSVATGCDKCNCPTCSNGATQRHDCTCKCPPNFGKNAAGDCSRCLLDDAEFCNSRGFVTPTCDGCICDGCNNGKSTDDCICKCEGAWRVDDKTGDCTICPVTCPDFEERLDPTTCECVTCVTTCDDYNECTNDTCIAGECNHELLNDCAKCLNVTDCGDCNSRSECQWVNCDDPGLVFGNGTIVRLTDLEVQAVNAERERLRAEACEKAKKKGDEEGELNNCIGLQEFLCVEAIAKDNVERIFELCPLEEELCPGAVDSNNQVFFIRFCRDGADGTLVPGTFLDTNDDPATEEETGKKNKDKNKDDKRSLLRRLMSSRSLEDIQTEDINIKIDGEVLNVTDVAEELNKDENRCIPAVLNNTLDCSNVGCGSTDNQITAAGLTIGAAVGGGASAGAGIAFFGAAWGLAFFRRSAGVPVDIPECNFDATDFFANESNAYEDLDGDITSSIFEESME